ncbi:Leucine zipper-EF-hand-containing transmembrane protein 1 [Citrus sinensis]|nr:Leucine zipper-EF-hand-containing transmembrane protein 1 [Citrus sinensis]
MASRAIWRRKRLISDHLGAFARVRQSFQCLGHTGGNFDSCAYSTSPNQSTIDFNQTKETDAISVTRRELLGFSGLRHIGYNYNRVTVLGLGNGRFAFTSPVGLRLMSSLVRNASTATAKQPEIGSDDEENEELARKKRKEASPEECDQAVVGLSSAKAKAKAKKLQESQKVAKSIFQRTWAMLLGIGPAFRAVASMSREDWAKKLVHWKHEFVSALQHYWLGSKLLWADVRISSRLLLKLADGKSLSRRERQQLTRTTADIFRLVPFAVFIIVPFMEFLLPVFLKLFPNMLPSTFQDKMKEQVRRGSGVSNEEILAFAKLFNDELTLDNISRPRLVNMCKYMGISPFGTDSYLRYMLRKRLQWIKNDDKLIQAEGVESLSEAELREDCRERGMLGLLSVEEMRQQLRDWLDLSLNHSVPSSLLILSRAFTVSGKLRPEEAVQATLSSLPDEVVGTVGVTALPSEDSVSERRRKLEYLAMQEELIKEEEEKEEKELARMKESKATEEDVALKEMTIPTAREAQEQARARALEKQEHLCKLSQALAVLASASSVSSEREEFLRLVNKEIELYNSLVEKEGTDGEKDAIKAYIAAREESDHATEVAEGDEVSSALVEKVDAMLQNLEKEIDDVDAIIGDRWKLLDSDHDGKVTPEEVASAALYLKDTLGKQGVQELISNLSKDIDGKILVEDIVRLGSRTEHTTSAEERGKCGG